MKLPQSFDVVTLMERNLQTANIREDYILEEELFLLLYRRVGRLFINEIVRLLNS